MKRLLSIFLAMMMSFSLTACGNDQVTDAVIDVVADAMIEAITDEQNAAAPTTSTTVSAVPEDSSSAVPPPDSSYDVSPEPSFSDAATAESPAPQQPAEVSLPVEEGEYYYDLEHVVFYLEAFGCLPENYITKNEARKLGWEGGTPERFLEGAAIGGDRFGNREGLLPDGDYTECDLNTDGKNSRGAERLVFSDEGDYYYTENHYESFTQVWVENWEVIWE